MGKPRDEITMKDTKEYGFFTCLRCCYPNLYESLIIAFMSASGLLICLGIVVLLSKLI